jgi:hypothetical protein
MVQGRPQKRLPTSCLFERKAGGQPLAREERSKMPRQLARLFGFLAQRHNTELPKTGSSSIPFKQDLTNEVLEHEGVLMVRLGRGSAMQMRLDPDRTGVVFRIVPIAKATRLEGDSTWHVVSDSQLRTWIHPDSAIGQWLMGKGLLSKGIDSDKTARELGEGVLPMTSPSRRVPFLALRSKSSMSLP